MTFNIINQFGGNIVDIENLMDEIEDILEASWRLPLSGGRAIVDSAEIKRILEDIRLKLPTEMTQAKRIVNDRAKIIESTRLEIDNMHKASEEKIKHMVSKSEIVRNAQISANSIIADATSRAKEIKNSAGEYVDNIMKELDQIIATNLSEVRKARQMLKSNDFKSDK